MKTAHLRYPAPEKNKTGVSVKNYKKLLQSAGFESHRHLTSEPIQLTDAGHVSPFALNKARIALENKFKDPVFIQKLGGNEIQAGLLNLTNFLCAY
jgi:hypothetical protein